jgi:hypothetical protein
MGIVHGGVDESNNKSDAKARLGSKLRARRKEAIMKFAPSLMNEFPFIFSTGI